MFENYNQCDLSAFGTKFSLIDEFKKEFLKFVHNFVLIILVFNSTNLSESGLLLQNYGRLLYANPYAIILSLVVTYRLAKV